MCTLYTIKTCSKTTKTISWGCVTNNSLARKMLVSTLARTQDPEQPHHSCYSAPLVACAVHHWRPQALPLVEAGRSGLRRAPSMSEHGPSAAATKLLTAVHDTPAWRTCPEQRAATAAHHEAGPNRTCGKLTCRPPWKRTSRCSSSAPHGQGRTAGSDR